MGLCGFVALGLWGFGALGLLGFGALGLWSHDEARRGQEEPVREPGRARDVGQEKPGGARASQGEARIRRASISPTSVTPTMATLV